MSSISITPTSLTLAPLGRASHTPRAVRLTRRGRVVFLLAFVALVAVAMIAMSALADAGSPQKVRYIQVAPGQTLTSIAQQLGGKGDIRDTIARIEQLNGMSGAALQAGQRLALPVR